MKKTFIALLALGITLSATSATARRPTNFAPLVGTWTNTNSATRGIVRIVIRQVGGHLLVQPFGACTPMPCNHGVIAARPFSPGVGNHLAMGFGASKNFGFKATNYNGLRYGNYLSLMTQDRFRHPDTRFDYSVMESFVRTGPAESESSEEPSESSDHLSRADLEP